MLFGEFNEEDLFHIEKSNIYKDIGSNIKTVEFILSEDNLWGFSNRFAL